MQEFDFDSVQYPMFELTEEEKGWLLEVKGKHEYPYLCDRLRFLLGSRTSQLCCKIQEVLGGEYLTTLEDALFIRWKYGRERCKLRDVWIDKLIEFNS